MCSAWGGSSNANDVVETVTSETETWLKFRDETETVIKAETEKFETSHFSNGN